MKKRLLTALSLILALLLCLAAACSGGGDSGSDSSSDSSADSSVITSDSSSSTPNPEPPQPEYVNILSDCEFKKGFDLMGLNGATDGTTVFKRIRYGSGLGTPQWKMAQWWCKYNLAYGVESSTVDKYVLKDDHKSVTVDIPTGDLTLALDSTADFPNVVTAAPSAWPHLLIEQALKTPVPIKGKKNLNANLSFTINKSEDKRIEGGAMLHSQFAWFIYIVDKNENSPGYGNFLWFGLNIYDSAREVSGVHSSQDTAGGPGNFIYSLSNADFLQEKIEVGKKNEFSFDILPVVHTALSVAQERGFMVGTTYNDISVTGTNIGWEIFDRWDESVTIHDISLSYEK